MNPILIVDDEEILARTIAQFLRKRGFATCYATDEKQAWQLFEKEHPPICLLDYRLGPSDGVELLERFKKARPQTEVIMMTGYGDMQVAITAMKAGARDFLVKPVPLTSIASMMGALSIKESSDQTKKTSASRLLGHSGTAVEIRASIERIVDSTRTLNERLPSVLITGESGTGKDLVAQAIHQDGVRAKGPMICVNCASLPPDLVESELFGHVKGAFTDAHAEKAGLFESAHGGVLFLDEIGDMPIETQAKLLRVLESQTIRRIGSNRDIPVDVWVIAATNQCLSGLVADGKFRADLMFRLQVLWVEVPPLRARDSDVLVLATEFLTQFADKYKRPVKTLSPSARASLIKHQWPGNIRELKNLIERAVILCHGEQLLPEHLHFNPLPSSGSGGLDNTATLAESEIHLVRHALEKTNGNVTRAATMLGVTRDTLRYRMEKHGLSRGD